MAFDPREVVRKLTPLAEAYVSTATVDVPFREFAAILKKITCKPERWASDQATVKAARLYWQRDFTDYFSRDVQLFPVQPYGPTADSLDKFWQGTWLFKPGSFADEKAAKRSAAQRAKAAAEVHRLYKNISSCLTTIWDKTRSISKGEQLLGIEKHIEEIQKSRGPSLTRKDIEAMYGPGTVLRDHDIPGHGLSADESYRKYVRDRLGLRLGREPSDGEVEAEYVLGYIRSYTNAFRGEEENAIKMELEMVAAYVSQLRSLLKKIMSSKEDLKDKEWLNRLAGEVLDRPLKRGEVVVNMPQVSRGGSVAGFRVVNEIGLSTANWDYFCDALATTRDLLTRKGFGFLVPMTKIIVGKRPEDKILIKATGSYGSIGGHYFHADGSIRIYYDSQQQPGYSHDYVTALLIHEIGHLYYFRVLPVPAQARQNTLFDQATSFVSSYAQQNPCEDFAETFAAYVSKQYHLPGHQYRMTRDAFERWKSVVLMDPKAKSLNLRAEAKISRTR